MDESLVQAIKLHRRWAGAEDHSFVFAIPGRSAAWFGAGGRRFELWPGRIRIEDEGHVEERPAGDEPLRALLDAAGLERPCLHLVGLDLHRGVDDPALPRAVLIQPRVLVRCDADGITVLAGERDHAARAAAVLAEESDPAPAAPAAAGTAWEDEGDAAFVVRLESAVAALRARPDGKMILMRPYRQPRPPPAEPARLFEIYAAAEPACAAAHLIRLAGGGCASVGCSPENVFEVDGDELALDVIAGTRGIADDAARDRRWAEELRTDPKEIGEHAMALARYEAHLQALCEAGSAARVFHRRERRLAGVRHLHTRLRGRLRPGTAWPDLLLAHYPPLESYPAELIPHADPRTWPTRFYGGMVGLAEGPRRAWSYLNLRAMLCGPAGLHTIGGVGVVAASEPRLELREVHNKLCVLMGAVAAWQAEAAARRGTACMVRRATPEDSPRILQILEYANYHRIGGPEMPAFPLADCFVAEIGGRVVGVAGYRILGPGEAKTTLMAVDPAARGTGAGLALQRARMDFLRGEGVRTLTTNTDDERTLQWYAKHFGYRPTGGTVPKVEDFGLRAKRAWTTIQCEL